jgi:hypothetical protein
MIKVVHIIRRFTKRSTRLTVAACAGVSTRLTVAACAGVVVSWGEDFRGQPGGLHSSTGGITQHLQIAIP